MKSLLDEFKAFMLRGNVIDLAVAVVIGAAFTAIVNSVVNDLIAPLIGLILGGVDFSGLSFGWRDAAFTYGNLIQSIVNFMIVGLVLFLVVKAMNQMSRKEAVKPTVPPAPTRDQELLAEIRDLLGGRSRDAARMQSSAAADAASAVASASPDKP